MNISWNWAVSVNKHIIRSVIRNTIVQKFAFDSVSWKSHICHKFVQRHSSVSPKLFCLKDHKTFPHFGICSARRERKKSFRWVSTMPVDIQNVLVCDAVDESCIQLLKQNGIKVIYSRRSLFICCYCCCIVESAYINVLFSWFVGGARNLILFLLLGTHVKLKWKKNWIHKSTGFYGLKKKRKKYRRLQNLKCREHKCDGVFFSHWHIQQVVCVSHVHLSRHFLHTN